LLTFNASFGSVHDTFSTDVDQRGFFLSLSTFAICGFEERRSQSVPDKILRFFRMGLLWRGKTKLAMKKGKISRNDVVMLSAVCVGLMSIVLLLPENHPTLSGFVLAFYAVLSYVAIERVK
jgi:hypothetical protein